MIVTENSNFQFLDGVYLSLSAVQKFSDFEKNYLAVRTQEKRILSIVEIRKLPTVPKTHTDYSLWELRKKNIERFLQYLSKKKSGFRILDIGCGNGFFTHMMAQSNTVVGVDVNLTELKQAAEAFPGENIKWYYCDILNETLPEANFDIITFGASFQYFNDPGKLLHHCKSLLHKNGEIHIIDSPFYTTEKKEQARKSSINYYRSMNAEGMINYYHHNSFDALNSFNYKFGYKPNNFLLKFFKDSPFPWIIIK